MIRPRLPALTIAAFALCAASTAFAQSDREIVDSTVARSASFPTDTRVWDAKGEELKNRTVPAFEPRPGAAVRVKTH